MKPRLTPTFSKLVRLGLGLGLAFGLPSALSPARAESPDSAPFYFYAQVAPSSSMVLTGPPTSELYLFWGAEGLDLEALGAGVEVVLERDNQVIVGPFRVGQVRSAEEIAARYAAPSEARRKLAMIDTLDKVFVGDEAVTPINFATRLHQFLSATSPCPPETTASCAANQRAFAQVLARHDANAAWAMYLGHRDPVPTATTTYRLVASKDGLTRELGRITVSPGQATSPLPAPTALEDVSHEQQRCDTPGLKAHGTLALAWDPPYSEPENAAVQLLLPAKVSGYLVLGSHGPCSQDEPTELAELARTASFDTRGELRIPGFFPLAESLVRAGQRPPIAPIAGRRLSSDSIEPLGEVPGVDSIIASGPTPAAGFVGSQAGTWRPTFASMTVGSEQVKALGLAPAARICVHVAAVDRAGQLGATRSVTARVADFEKPPAPWDVRVDTETESAYDVATDTTETTERFSLNWRPVTAQSLLARNGEVVLDALGNPKLVPAVNCNPASTGRLEWAPTAAECAKPEARGFANLEIAEYLVYRFDNEPAVARFLDTDGDGRADGAERTSELDPGPACSPDSPDTSVLVGRIPVSASIPEEGSNTPTYRFVDDTPTGANKGKVFWYVIAARGENGWVGPMSAPVRGIFHEHLPMKPLPGSVFGTCEPEIAPVDPDLPFVALDMTDTQRALGGKVRLYCLSTNELMEPLAKKLLGYVGEAPFEEPEAPSEGSGFAAPPRVSTTRPQTDALYQEVITTWLVGQRGGSPCLVYAEVVDSLGRVVAKSDPRVDLVPMGSNSGDFGFHLFDGCTTSRPKPVKQGQVISGPLTVSLPAGTPATVCVDINYEADDGNLFKLAILCGANSTSVDPPDTGGETQCYSVAYKGPNFVPGPQTSHVCVKKKTSAPPLPPSLWNLDLPHAEDRGSLRWKAPSTPIAGIIVQIEERLSGVFRTEFLVAGQPDSLGFLTGELDLRSNDGIPMQPPAGVTQTWCVKARSVSATSSGDTGGMLSEWTGSLCGPRARPDVPLPSYLPWPEMESPPIASKTYQTGYLAREGVPFVTLGAFDPAVVWPTPDTSLDPDNNVSPCGEELAARCYTSHVPGAPSCIEPEDDSQFTSSTCIEACIEFQRVAAPFGNTIVYRKSKADSVSPWGPWVQVTPFLSRPLCFGGTTPSQSRRLGLRDPNFVAARFAPNDTAEPRYEVAFVDRHPHEPGTIVTYAFVRFGNEGQIVETIRTQELAIPAEEAP